MNKFNPLLDVMSLVRTYLCSNLYVSRKSQIVSCELLHIWLHRCTEHVESFVVAHARKHLLLFFENLVLSSRLLDLLGDLSEYFIDGLLEIVVYHFISFVKNYKVTLVKHQSST